MKVVIVGGVAGGASAAARIRRLDEHAQSNVRTEGEYQVKVKSFAPRQIQRRLFAALITLSRKVFRPWHKWF